MSTLPALTFRSGRALAAGGILLILGASYLLAPWIGHGPVICPLRAASGFPCPGCGMTRAFAALAHGHLANALMLNAASLPAFAGLLVALPLLLLELLRGRALATYSFLYSQRLAMAIALVMVGYNLARTAWWAWSGTLATEYLHHSWWYWLATRAGLLA
jgi:hypothetical protein